MGRPKGGINRKHSIEFKIMVVKKHLEGNDIIVINPVFKVNKLLCR